MTRFRPRRYRPGNMGTWSGHLAFANDLVRALQPGLLVELGTHHGESYFGFCQAVEESGAKTRCFAVDTWRGDEHAGFYGDEVYEEVLSYNAAHYEDFSTLVRGTFDEASAQFETESIGLLHIDGLHTYDAVKHDFETWFSKVQPGGIVLLHDTNVRHADFEVWRLWQELAREYAHFEFLHCWGLGVLRKPGGGADCALLDSLFRAGADEAERIRNDYSEEAALLESGEIRLDRPYLQVFTDMKDTGFQEKNSVLSNIEEGVWKLHSLTLPWGSGSGLLRVDPVNRPALVEISEMTVRLPGGEATIPIPLSGVRCASESMPIPSGEIARFFSWGTDPQLMVELPGVGENNAPLQFEIMMRVEFTFEPLSELLAGHNELQGEIGRLRMASSKEHHSRARLEWQLASAETHIAHLQKENTRLRSIGKDGLTGSISSHEAG